MNNEIKKIKDDDFFYKIYKRDVLLCSDSEIENRLVKIKKNSRYFFDYKWSKSNLTIKTKLFENTNRKITMKHLVSLAIYLDRIHRKNHFHGDIHERNIIIDNQKLFLIDWEPCFIQKLFGKRIIKSHYEGIATEDKKNKRISTLTDKKGFLKLLPIKYHKLIDTNLMSTFSCSQLLNSI